jgi:long-chain acyl-CoA synthetase
MMLEDLKELKPTIFGSFPMFLNKLYRNTCEKMAKEGKKAEAFFIKALQEKTEALHKTGKLTHPIYDRLIFDKIKQVLGGNIRLLISGGAPLSKDVKDFLFVAFGCPVLEAYGVSENAGAVSSTSRWETRAGVVGGPIAGIKMKLCDIPELGYLTTDNPPRGEVCVKGNSVF